MHILGTNGRVLTGVDSPQLETPALEVSLGSASSNGGASSSEHRLVPLLSWLAVILTLVFIPLKIISYGYLPGDDALRHAAKAVSGRDWSDILIIQEQFKTDHNPGWHWILSHLHEASGADTEGLVVIAVCGLVLLFCFVPLGWIRRPEAWIASLLAGIIVSPNMLCRIFLGRPFALSVSATLAILLLWRNRAKFPPALLAGTTLLFAVGSWVHGSWYLFSLVVAAFALSGQFQSALRLLGCWFGGSLLAGLLTGHPLEFLWNAVNIGITCFSQHQVQRMLVSEFQPSAGDPVTLLMVAVLIAVRIFSGRWNWSCVRNPIFMLAVLGWILGLRVVRFWLDWGMPALSLWAALELQEHLRHSMPVESLRRLGITAGLCAALYFAVTADVGDRWTRLLTAEQLNDSDPEMHPWLPEDGGILYSADLSVFYQTFFKNPHAKWKYILGFESTFMLPEDLRIYRNIQWNYYAHKAFEPWVAKMRPQDRLVMMSSSSTPPSIPALEWKNVARQTWVGRLPRNANTAPATPSPNPPQSAATPVKE
jgi:hypothetical protein